MLLILFFLKGVEAVQAILDKIERYITINGVRYGSEAIREGDVVTAIITNIAVDDIKLGEVYKLYISDKYIGESDIQSNFSNKWNRGTILYDSIIQGRITKSRNNMILIESDVFTGWIPKMYIERICYGIS